MAHKPARATIVVPTIRQESIHRFLDNWAAELTGQRLIIVEDNPGRTFDLPSWVEHYCWSDIDAELGADSWIIPRRSDCVRSYGYFKAAQQPAQFIWTLDDDCYPEPAIAGRYLELIGQALNRSWPDDHWWNTLAAPLYPRGYPFNLRGRQTQTVLHHGLWSNVPDLDAVTQTQNPDLRTEPARQIERVPGGAFFAMCGMNLAFRPQVVPALYFLLMGKDREGNAWPYDRFGDIWAGIFVKRIIDHLDLAAISGAPSVHHARASSVAANLVKETPGYAVNDWLWREIGAIRLTGASFRDCYLEMARELPAPGDYWTRLKRAMETWAGLFPADSAR